MFPLLARDSAEFWAATRPRSRARLAQDNMSCTHTSLHQRGSCRSRWVGRRARARAWVKIKSEERTLPRLPPSSRRSLLSCRCARAASPAALAAVSAEVSDVRLRCRRRRAAEDERAQIWAPDLVECSTRTQKSCVTLHLTTKPV